MAIHQWGWTVTPHPDGTTTARSPDGTKTLHSHGPPTARGRVRRWAASPGTRSLERTGLLRTRLYDRNRKKDVYQGFGIPAYWIVEPDRDRPELTAFRLRPSH